MTVGGKVGIEGLINHLKNWVREEIVLQNELLAALDEQSQSIRGRGSERLETATEAVDVKSKRARDNEVRRANLFTRLAKQWDVAPRSLTFPSIALRAEAHGEALAELSTELRSVVQAVQTKARLVQSELRMHQRITVEVLGALLGQGEDGAVTTRGALLNAEA